jgi:hypothetical protein
MGRLALYTTVYPGVERYLSTWYESVEAQTDSDFDIWIGVDGFTIEEVKKAMGSDLSAKWVMAAESDTPARIREKAIAQMVDEHSVVVFVDSDDVLKPTRVQAARSFLKEYDVNGCTMRIIDEKGAVVGKFFTPSDVKEVHSLLPKRNVFGLTNTAYRSHVLRRCLPIPKRCVLVDWYLITRAWASQACLSFDPKCRMIYRQYSDTMAPVLPPYTAHQILSATELVMGHYQCILSQISDSQVFYGAELESAFDYTAKFYSTIRNFNVTLDEYVEALNEIQLDHMWWACVAHPELEEIWMRN